jgi:tetratricopeptide (TPR) repeat protein
MEQKKMDMIKLNCPSCNGALELPDNLGIAHCMYCGTKILLRHNDNKDDEKTIERLIELRKVAIEANNFVEALGYCNSILEIDPKNDDAWIDKAISVFCLTTLEKQRYSESMEYLNKASLINPANERIEEVREKIISKQTHMLNELGINEFNCGHDLYCSVQQEHFLDGPRAEREAKSLSLGHYLKGMDYFMEALSIQPENMEILKNIATCVSVRGWVDWSPKVREAARKFNSSR